MNQTIGELNAALSLEAGSHQQANPNGKDLFHMVFSF
jgi:hypothetical protein